uniref:Uncharacterized protein n=1 Tax=Anas zonorhyncha TaxID=75864 RepID=A0A8B9ULJ0_9AVES
MYTSTKGERWERGPTPPEPLPRRARCPQPGHPLSPPPFTSPRLNLVLLHLVDLNLRAGRSPGQGDPARGGFGGAGEREKQEPPRALPRLQAGRGASRTGWLAPRPPLIPWETLQ